MGWPKSCPDKKTGWDGTLSVGNAKLAEQSPRCYFHMGSPFSRSSISNQSIPYNFFQPFGYTISEVTQRVNSLKERYY